MLLGFSRWRRLVAEASAGLAFLLFAGSAEAESRQRYAVKWTVAEGAQGCLQQAELTAAVAKLVSAEQLAPAEQADRVIFGSVRHDESWHATLRVVDVTGNALGERELENTATSCNELSASVALAIALIIDPEHMPASGATATASGAEGTLSAPTLAHVSPAVPAASPVAAVRVPPSSASDERESASSVKLFSPPPRRALKASAVLLSGLLPEVAIGAQLEFWQPLLKTHSLRLALAYFGAQTLDVPGRDGASAKLYLITARAAYCPLLAANPAVSVFGCAGLESGLLIAHGQGGGYESTPARGLLALDGALTVDWSLVGPWVVSLTAGAAVTPYRPKFYYQAANEAIEVQRRGVLEGRLEIGLGYRF